MRKINVPPICVNKNRGENLCKIVHECAKNFWEKSDAIKENERAVKGDNFLLRSAFPTKNEIISKKQIKVIQERFIFLLKSQCVTNAKYPTPFPRKPSSPARRRQTGHQRSHMTLSSPLHQELSQLGNAPLAAAGRHYGQAKTAGEKIINGAVAATTKFIEGYVNALGTGAAALTIGAVGALLFHIGLGKEVLAPIWDRLRPGK